MKAPEQHVLQQPRPCSWVSIDVDVDVDSGVHVVVETRGWTIIDGDADHSCKKGEISNLYLLISCPVLVTPRIVRDILQVFWITNRAI